MGFGGARAISEGALVEGDVYHGCLSRGGDLSRVTVNEVPEFKGSKTLIQWNETGPAGEDGQNGEPGPQAFRAAWTQRSFRG